MFDAPAAPDLNLIDPGTELTGALSYNSPNFQQSIPVDNSARNMMFASAGMSAIGAVTSAFSQASALRAQGDYQQTIADTNAKIADLQSRQTLEAGDLMASRKNLQTQQQVGAERAAQGASGVDVASGSAAVVRAGTAGIGAQDELTIRNNAARQAWGYQTEAMEDTYRGQFAQLTAKAGAEQSLMSGGLQAIEGPMAMYAKYKYMQKYLGVGGYEGGGSGVPYPNMATGN